MNDTDDVTDDVDDDQSGLGEASHADSWPSLGGPPY
jgi:hypothetical protein